MSVNAGVSCKLYYNSGTHGSPTWVAVDDAKDVMVNLGMGKAEVKRRGNGWVQTLPTLKTAPITFGMVREVANTPHNTLRDAYLNKTVMDFAVADGAIATTGTQYFRADYYLYAFPINQPLEEAEDINVEADLAVSSNAPAFTTV